MSDDQTPATPVLEPEEMRKLLTSQAAGLIMAFRRGELSPEEAAEISRQMAELADEIAADQSLGRDGQELAAFMQGAAAVLGGGDWPEVPGDYADLVVRIETGVAAGSSDDDMAADGVSAYDQAARAAFQAGDLARAIDNQEQAVDLARGAGTDRPALVRLSVMLYNLAGYYGQAGRPREAVTALEEVVALDRQTGHPDLEKDEEMLAAAREAAAGLAEQQAAAGVEAATKAEAAGLSVEAQLLLAELAGQVAALPAEEQADLQWQMLRHELVQQAGMAIAGLRRGELAPEAAAQLARQVERSARQVAAGAATGHEGRDLAAFLRSAAQVLKGWPWAGVPDSYRAIVRQIEAAAGGGRGPVA
jgi:tetratricopeptide (TPR) repeat protein